MGRSPCSLFVYSLAMLTDVVAYECYDLALIQMRAAVRGAEKADAPASSRLAGMGGESFSPPGAYVDRTFVGATVYALKSFNAWQSIYLWRGGRNSAPPIIYVIGALAIPSVSVAKRMMYRAALVLGLLMLGTNAEAEFVTFAQWVGAPNVLRTAYIEGAFD